MTSLKELIRETSTIALTHQDCTAGEDKTEGYIKELQVYMSSIAQPSPRDNRIPAVPIDEVVRFLRGQ
jgi:hypothetical protein